MKRSSATLTKCMVLLLGIAMLAATSTVAFAWWDRLGEETDGQLQMGTGVRLVLDEQTSEDLGVLVPSGSFYAGVEGYVTEYVFEYVLHLEEDLGTFDLLIDIENLTIGGVAYDTAAHVHGPLNVDIETSEGAFETSGYDHEITGPTSNLRLNEVLQGDGTVTITLTFTLMDHTEDALFEGDLVEAYEALAGKPVTFHVAFEIPPYEAPPESPGLSYLFGELDPHDFVRSGTWNSAQAGFRSGFGLLFIENPYEAYEITLVAQLGIDEPEDATSGGFALLFETTLDEDSKDSGYALQFDRGLGGIVIRPRSSGGESSPILTVTHTDNPFIPESKRSPFWTEEKTVVLRVEPDETTSGQRNINVWIDEEHIIEDFSLEASTETEQAYTGMRSWHRITEYRSLTIDPLDTQE